MGSNNIVGEHLTELMTENFRSFSVVPPCEVFASLFLNTVFDYLQKNPLIFSILRSYYQINSLGQRHHGGKILWQDAQQGQSVFKK
jgi:hypothetical protein